MDKWSKLEVDDALEKWWVDVTGLEYFYMWPRMSLENGLVRLFDNQSAIDMAKLGVYYGVGDVYAVQVGGMVIDDADGPVMPMSQLTQEEVQNPMEEEIWDYNENWSSVRVTTTRMEDTAARMEDGVAASSSSEEEDEGQEGGEGADEPGEGSGEGYMFFNDGLGQDSTSENEVDGELEVEGGGGLDSDMYNEEFEEEVVATKKGKRKVDEVEQSKRRSKAKGNEKADGDGPTFFDSDYDLSDNEENEI